MDHSNNCDLTHAFANFVDDKIGQSRNDQLACSPMPPLSAPARKAFKSLRCTNDAIDHTVSRRRTISFDPTANGLKVGDCLAIEDNLHDLPRLVLKPQKTPGFFIRDECSIRIGNAAADLRQLLIR